MDHAYRPELVARAKTLLAREATLNWEWGDLLAEAAPAGAQSDAVLHGFLEEIGWFDTGRSLATAKQLRKVAVAFPPDKREPKASFTAHAELAEFPGRFDVMRPGLGKREARRLAGRRALRDDKDAPAARLADILANPDAVERAKEDPELADEIMAFASRVQREVATAEREQVEQRDEERGYRSPFLDATRDLRYALTAVQRAAKHRDALAGVELEEYLEQLDAIAREVEVQKGAATFDRSYNTIQGGAS